MKHWLALTLIVALGLAAITLSERRKVDVPPGPAAILYLVADTERELTRMPVRFTRMSDEQEIAIGNHLASAYESELKENHTPSSQTVEGYLREVGSRLVAHAHRRLPYRFHYIPGKSFVNAFALPGGHVYLGQGLLARMDSEDELAAVLGHEIEHVDHYHCVERVQLEQAVRKLPFGRLASIPVELFEAGYGKDQEMEADGEGTRLAVAAGYSPNGAIRMFEGFQRSEQALRTKARNPEEEVSEVANETLEGYFRSHPLPSERIAQIQKLIASERWPVVAERDLELSYFLWGQRAEDLFNQHRYGEAQQAALQSLKKHPDYPPGLQALAHAYFSQANFADAAATYRKLLERDNSHDTAWSYAIALAAADRRNADKEFDQWIKAARPGAEEMRVTLAGLALLAENPAPADALYAGMIRQRGSLPPDQPGELGWWYYLAGDYPKALNLLQDAVQQRPGELQWLTDRAWVQIESRNFEDALRGLNEVDTAAHRDQSMAKAVAYWLSAQKDASLPDFEIAVEAHPEWKNPKWVGRLYSPLVGETVQQMVAEQARQRERQQAQTARP